MALDSEVGAKANGEIKVRFKTLVMSTVLSAFVLPGGALAFDPDNDAEVMSRPRPEFDAVGVPVGSFMFFPTLTAGVEYTDNVFNVPEGFGEVEDFIFSLTPAAKLKSNFSRHALNFTAEAISLFYNDFGSEDRTDWGVGADGRIDIARGTDIAGEIHYRDAHEARASEDLILIAEPVAYTIFGGAAAINHSSGHFRGSVGATYDEFDFDDSVGFGPINNDDRDRSVTEAYAKLGVAVSPGTGVFVRGRWNQRDYDAAVDDFGFNHDSDGWAVEGGLDFEVTRLLVGEIYGGYTEQSYDDAAFAPTDTFVYGAGLKWFPSLLTTVTLKAKRSIEESSVSILFASASGYISDDVSLQIDHELLRNFIVWANAGYGQNDYQEILRNDDILTAGLGAIFLINNNLHLNASYRIVDRSSDDPFFDYSNNSFTLSLTGKL
jgi:hypothetical protein